jgi:hypothetical protein
VHLEIELDEVGHDALELARSEQDDLGQHALLGHGVFPPFERGDISLCEATRSTTFGHSGGGGGGHALA